MRVWTFLILGWLMTTILACSAPRSQSAGPRVPITTLEQIVGKWEGLSQRLPDMLDHAEVVLIISQSGHFNFVSDRGTDMMLGTGSLTIADGRVVGKSSSGSGTLTLRKNASHLVLVAEVALNDGSRYYIEMTR